MKSRRFSSLTRVGQLVKVVAEKAGRVQVVNLITGNRDWMDAVDFRNGFREIPRYDGKGA